MASTINLTLLAIGLTYPFLVYLGLRVMPAGVVALALVALLALRITVRRAQRDRDDLPFVVAAAIILLVLVRFPLVGLKIYPIVLSLTFAVVFGYSLLSPPLVVERLARLRQPDLPVAANSYLRKVTIAWLFFFIVNATISAATAASGSIKLWTLYNGLISYILMGLLFAGEFLVRQRVRERPRRERA
jgi:uncharacterized membrane protein